MKTIVILGAHKTGTSLVAELLYQMGVHMGDRLLGPGSNSNPRGHFEDIDFLELNELILQMNQGSWYNPPSAIGYKNTKQSIMDLIIKKNQANHIWGWKDPRNCLTIHLYYPYLVNPLFIVCCRSCLESAHSLRRRDGIAIDEGIKLFNWYNYQITQFLDGIKQPRLFLSFEQFFKEENRISQIKELERFIGVSEHKAELAEVIDSSLYEL